MTADSKQPSYIPIRFMDEHESEAEEERTESELGDSRVIDLNETEAKPNGEFSDFAEPADGNSRSEEVPIGGPEVAELVASRAELKRLQGELAEAKDAAARRQADFENYRKRIERDRSESH